MSRPDPETVRALVLATIRQHGTSRARQIAEDVWVDVGHGMSMQEFDRPVDRALQSLRRQGLIRYRKADEGGPGWVAVRGAKR